MANMIKISNWHNRKVAVMDFNAIAGFAIENGQSAVVSRHAPDLTAGWQKIDKATANIRKELQAVGLEVPINPSAK